MTAAGDVVAAYWAAAEARDWDRFGALLADDVVYEAPQTRERVRGRAAYLRFNAEGFPGDWHPDHRLRAGSVRATGRPGRPDRALLTAVRYQRSWAIVS